MTEKETLSGEWKDSFALVALLGVYFQQWWNRFLGASSNGWHLFNGHQVAAGKVPYRDFYLYLPPLHVLKFALISRVLGDYLIVGRMLAVFERLILGVVLYRLLALVYRREYAFPAALLSMILFCSDPADALPLHHHDAVLWATVCIYAAMRALNSPRGQWLAGLSGLSAGLCGLSKHTVGVPVSSVVFALLLWHQARTAGRRTALRLGGAFAAAWLAPVSAVLIWLWRENALPQFADQVFLRGPASKGSPAAIFLRPILGPAQTLGLGYPAVLALLFLAALYFLPRRGAWRLTAIGAFAAHGVTIALLFPWPLKLMTIFETELLFVGLYGCSLLAMGALRKIRAGGERSLMLFCGSAAVCYGLSLSWPAYGPMAIPALAIVICWAFTRLEGSRNGLIAGWLLWAVTVFGGGWAKAERPFDWEGWKEPPVSTATGTSRLAALQGLQLSPEVIAFTERVTEDIRGHSGPQDRVYVFPHLPIFYLLAERAPATFDYLHWFDVTPDAIAREDAARLVADPPKVLAIDDLREEDIQRNEGYYRRTGRSGQRDLIATLHGMESGYCLVDTLRMPGGTNTLRVLARRDPGGAECGR